MYVFLMYLVSHAFQVTWKYKYSLASFLDKTEFFEDKEKGRTGRGPGGGSA